MTYPSINHASHHMPNNQLIVKANTLRTIRLHAGRTPGPGWRQCIVYRQTGAGSLPLALPL